MGIHLAMLVIARRAISYCWSVSVVVYMIGYVILFLLIYLFSPSLFRINPKMKKKEGEKKKERE